MQSEPKCINMSVTGKLVHHVVTVSNGGPLRGNLSTNPYPRQLALQQSFPSLGTACRGPRTFATDTVLVTNCTIDNA